MGRAKKSKGVSSATRGWKDIPQEVGSRPVSLLALRRRLIRIGKGVGLFFIVVSLGVLIWQWSEWYSERGKPVDLTGPSPSIAKVEFASDGALDFRWFGNWISIEQDDSLMEVDIRGLRRELESIGQVESAVVKRVFPDSLHVRIKEHRPILRLLTRLPGEKPVLYLVSSSGVVFSPENFRPAVLLSLPYLDIEATRFETTAGFKTIEGAAEVAELLDLARRNYPALYQDWGIVEFDRLGSAFDGDPGSHVLIKSGKVKRLRFGAEDFPGQMRRLKYLLHEPKVEALAQIESIDLSLGKSVFLQTK